MRPQPSYYQAGFTAVELLITLLIASMFLFSGYQLYTQVNRDGSDANKAARVSSLVSEKVRATIASSTATCGASIPNETKTETGVGSVTYVTSVTCPNPDTPTMRLVKVTATYDNPTKTLEHATYAN